MAHYIQFLDDDGKVVATRTREGRDEAYAAFDEACASATEGTVIMREGGRVSRRYAVQHTDAGVTEAPEPKPAPKVKDDAATDW